MEDGIIDGPIPPENIPIPWKSYNTTPIPLLEIPPFDPLALKHTFTTLRHRYVPEYKFYLAFTRGQTTFHSLTQDYPINFDTDFITNPLGQNLNRYRKRIHSNAKGKKKGEKRKESTLTRTIRMAEALSFLYQSESVTPGHAVWWRRRYGNTEGGRLVGAVERICQAERLIEVRPGLW